MDYVINPLCNQHIFDVDLSDIPSDELIINTYNFLKKELKYKQSPKKLLHFVKISKNPLVFKILIEFLHYPLWINWYNNTSILKYYWSDDLILKIIDANRSNIYNAICNNEPYDMHLINLFNQYDMKYNFTEIVIEKRKNNLQNIINQTLEHPIDIKNFYGGKDTIMFLGSNFLNINKEKKIFDVSISLYPKKSMTINIKPNTLYEILSDCTNAYFKTEFYTIALKIFTKNYAESNIILNEGGFIDFETNKIPANAELYQLFNNYKVIVHDAGIELPESLIKSPSVVRVSTGAGKPSQIKYINKRCYECKKYFSGLTLSEYDVYCIDCGEKNYKHKSETADLKNFTAFITGIRVKIGLGLSLKILRCGGSVIGTTRYPNFALYNFSQEKDYDAWKDRLTIIKCDFTNFKNITALVEKVSRYKINAFINNAFRTIRPSDFYMKSIEKLESEMGERLKLKDIIIPDSIVLYKKNVLNEMFADLAAVDTSQLVVYVPSVQMSVFHDIKDIPHDHTWDKKIEEIDPTEIIECVAINQLVPTLLINALKAKLEKPKFIIHVSSLEGQFNAKKTDKHLHTNMCKTALNMLIRTLLEDEDPELGVFAIDPGFVSGVNAQNDKYPVSMHDAASKILYPIIRYYNGNPLDKTYAKMRCYEKGEW